VNARLQKLLNRLQRRRDLWLRLQGWWLRVQQLLLQLQSLVRRLPPRWRAVLTTCVYGLGAGASAVAFQLGMNWFFHLGFVRLSRQSPAMFYAGSFVLIIGSSLIVGWLLNSFCREAAGSGIPQLKLAFLERFWPRAVPGYLGEICGRHPQHRRRIEPRSRRP
jgi:H+/Cl- antiporter ClcA